MSFTFLEIKSGRLWYQGKRRKGEKERHRLGAYRWFCYITICHVWFNRTRTHMMPTKTNIAEYMCLHRAEPNDFCARGVETTIIWVFWINKLLKRLIRCCRVDFQWIMTQISACLSHKTTAWTQNIKHELCRPFLLYFYGVFLSFWTLTTPFLFHFGCMEKIYLNSLFYSTEESDTGLKRNRVSKIRIFNFGRTIF